MQRLYLFYTFLFLSSLLLFFLLFFFFNDTATTEIYTLSLHDALPILSPVTTPSVEPGLNPNQPNQRMITPSVVYAMLCPGIAFGFPSWSNFPIRGPSRSAPARAASAPW